MKIRILFFVVAVMVSLVACSGKEVPIKGTNLVTYTKNNKIGVKEPGEKGKIILYAEYVSVEAYGGWLWVKTEENADFNMFHENGKEAFAAVKILETGNNYRIIRETALKGKRYIPEKKTGLTNNAPYEEMFVAQIHGNNYIFVRNMGYWGVTCDDRYDNVLSNKYDKIWILSTELGKKVFFFGRTEQSMYDREKEQGYKVKVWHCAEKNGETYSPYNGCSEERVNELINGSTLKMEKLDRTLIIYEK
ncbi:MAG: hypothetical protein LBL90_08410 [Prevotellaceae bacterium]|jgi:hypothetical protein|nr:hypothetical protein [Prevotellaceae bacterium]